MEAAMTDMLPIDVLRGMRELLSDESKWTRMVFARSAEGFPCEPTSEKASCWCLAGAAFRVAGAKICPIGSIGANDSAAALAWQSVQKVRLVIESEFGGVGVGPWQDAPERKFSDVAQAIERAIVLEGAA